MSELYLFVLAGAVLLVFFLRLLVSTRPGIGSYLVPADSADIMETLPGLSFSRADLLTNDSDYRVLQSNPIYGSVARDFWRERQGVVLLWLSLLRRDVLSLWRLRRLLARNGVPVSGVEEIGIAIRAIGALAFLFSLRIVVLITGPFAFPRLLRGARGQVVTSAVFLKTLLDRLPSLTRAEIERQWRAELAVAGT
ncbi:MAG: hypothetical protein L0338_34610 [Acidobacteria bacterium]|nr:hypothetical protein [Acidobacteriota bacterium]